MKRNVIIDCDPGIDDSLALMLALSSEEIEVVGITIVCGNSPAEMGFENAKKVLAHMNRLDIPIYKGAEAPLSKPYCNALDTHGEDGLGESYLPSIKGYRQKKDAVTFLAETLRETSCMVIALGPLTNLAHLIEKDAAAFSRITQLVSMGGSYKAHGNCSPVAEYNYWEDPEAADIVFKQLAKEGKLLHMVGLDVTRKIVLTPNLLAYIERLDPKQGAFIRSITKFYYDFHWKQEHLIGCVINDPLAVAYVLDPTLCSGFPSYVQLATEGAARGQTIVDAYAFYQQPANAHILTEVNTKGFFQLFLSRVLHLPKEELDILDHLL